MLVPKNYSKKIFLDQENELNESRVVSVKIQLFTESTPQKENNYGAKNLVISNETNDLLREKFEIVNNSCVLTIKNKNITKKGLTCYGICRHESCKQFKLVVEKNQLIVWHN